MLSNIVVFQLGFKRICVSGSRQFYGDILILAFLSDQES